MVIIVGAVLFVLLVAFLLIRGSHAQPSWNASQTAESETTATRGNYFYRVARAGDVFINVVLLGKEDETISTRTWRWSLKPHGREFSKLVTRVLYGIQKQHGVGAATGDVGRAQATIKRLTPIIAGYQDSDAAPR